MLPKTTRESTSSNNLGTYKETAQAAGTKLTTIGKSVWGLFGGGVGPATSR